MSNLDGVANAPRRVSVGLLLGLLPLAGMLAACGGGGGSGVPGNDPTDPLIVLAATPTNSQETVADGSLSDPGLNGKLIVNFTSLPRYKDVIDPVNDFNGLTPNVQILNQGFFRVPGTPGFGLWIETQEPICAGLIAGAALVGITDVLVRVFLL